MTMFPIIDDVMMPCHQCHATVWCRRTVYPDETSFVCKPKGHRFRYKLQNGESIPGDKQIKPPNGYGVND